MSNTSEARDNLIQLPRLEPVDRKQAAAIANRVRQQLSLLQGYADLMVGLTPEQSVNILRVMAQKIDELTEALRPLVDHHDAASPSIQEYRAARALNRQLMAEYRLLLRQLRTGVDNMPSGLFPPALGAGR